MHPVDQTSGSSPDEAGQEESFRQANRAQREEIVKHRELMIKRLGRLVSLDEAARDWIRAHAANWRAEFEKRAAHH